MSPRARRRLAAVLALVALEALVGWLLDGADFMGALAAVRHGHFLAAGAFAVYLALRLVVTVLIPAACLAWTARVAWETVKMARGRGNPLRHRGAPRG